MALAEEWEAAEPSPTAKRRDGLVDRYPLPYQRNVGTDRPVTGVGDRLWRNSNSYRGVEMPAMVLEVTADGGERGVVRELRCCHDIPLPGCDARAMRWCGAGGPIHCEPSRTASPARCGCRWATRWYRPQRRQ